MTVFVALCDTYQWQHRRCPLTHYSYTNKHAIYISTSSTPQPVHHLLIGLYHSRGVGPSSEVERSLMVRWVVGSILHGVDPLGYFSSQPVLHDWCNKGRGMCYLVCGMMHIKEPLLLIRKSSLCGSFSLSEWSDVI